MDSNGPSMGYKFVIDGFNVGTRRLSMGFKCALAQHRWVIN